MVIGTCILTVGFVIGLLSCSSLDILLLGEEWIRVNSHHTLREQFAYFSYGNGGKYGAGHMRRRIYRGIWTRLNRSSIIVVVRSTSWPFAPQTSTSNQLLAVPKVPFHLGTR